VSDTEIGALSDRDLADFERRNPAGVTVQQLVDAFAGRLTEATFRKYVQVGLLPRSVRVGRKGKNRGSQGLYPATVARRIELVRRLMAEGHTIEEIQRDYLFARGELEELDRALDRAMGALARQVQDRGDELASRKLAEARTLGASFGALLAEIEQRVSMRARMERAVV
jgi:hypothetical protein